MPDNAQIQFLFFKYLSLYVLCMVSDVGGFGRTFIVYITFPANNYKLKLNIVLFYLNTQLTLNLSWYDITTVLWFLK